MTLGEYLKAAAATPWQAGEHDCSAWPARWAGVPLPVYATDEEGQRLVDETGGLLPLWRRCIGDRLAHVEPVHGVLAGDVGIIEAVGTDLRPCHVGAIWTGKRWAFLTPKGLACASAVCVAAWRVECPRL